MGVHSLHVSSLRRKEHIRKCRTTRTKSTCANGREKDLPAMLILAGVAFREAGVLVRLLLVGVMPLTVEKVLDNDSQYISNGNT